MIRRLLESPVAFHTLNRALEAVNDVNFRRLRQVLHPHAESWMLDVGCGTGRYAGRWNCRYIGVDTDPRYVQFAAHRWGGRFLRADATR